MEFGIVSTIGSCPLGRSQAAILGLLLSRSGHPFSIIGSPQDISGLDMFGWNLIVTEDPRLKLGFQSKLYVHEYSPYQRTLFLDVDILPIHQFFDLDSFVDGLSQSGSPVSFYANRTLTNGSNSMKDYQGTTLETLNSIGYSYFWMSLGGGHYLWESNDQTRMLFSRALELIDRHGSTLKKIKTRDRKSMIVPDELAVSLAITELYPDARLPDDLKAIWLSLWKDTPNPPKNWTYLHFMAKKGPLVYDRLCRKLNVPISLRYRHITSWISLKSRGAFFRIQGK